MPEHDGGRGRQAHPVRRLDHRQPLPVLSLSGQMISRMSSDRISAAVPGRVLSPSIFELSQESPEW